MLKPEESEQIALFDWIRLFRPDLKDFVFHIANERKTSKQYGYKLKRMGVRSGVSDIFLAVPTKKYYGLFLELKAGVNKPTPNQIQFMLDMRKKGYQAIWCVGFDEAKYCIEEYLE